MSIIKDVFKKEDEKGNKGKPEKGEKEPKDTSKKKAAKKKPGSGKNVKTRVESVAHRVLVKPIISEKATFLNAENKYVFEVGHRATKAEIKQAVKDVYGVEPTKVNVIRIEGKARRYGRTMGRTNNRKKAVVSLPEGESIQVFEGV